MQQVLRHNSLPASLLGLLAGAVSIATFWALPLGLWVAVAIGLSAIAVWLLVDPGRWPLAFLAAVIVLPPLPLPLGDTGVHPALFVAGVGLWAGALRLRDWQPRFGILPLSLLALLLVLALSVPAAAFFSGPMVAAGSAARIGLLGLTAYTFFYLACGPGRAIPADSLVRTVFCAGFVSAAFAAADFYFQLPVPARFAEQYVWLSDGVYRRAQGTFYEASTLASLCILMLALTVSAGFWRTVRTLGLGSWSVPAGGSLFLMVLVLSFSRTAIASLLVALAVVVALRAANGASLPRFLRAAAAGVICLACVLALAAWILPSYLGAYAMRLRQSAEFFFSEPNLVLSRRVEAWQHLIGYLAENPERLFFGIGYKTLPYTGYLGRPVIADNMYLSILVEAGWLGLAALLLLSASVLIRGYREASGGSSSLRRACGATAMGFWCGFLIQMFSGDVLTYWRVLPVVFALLAVGERDEDSVSRPV